MNVFEVDCDDFAEIGGASNVLDTWQLPYGLTLHVAEHQGRDWLFFCDNFSGGTLLVDAEDAAYGGSTHDRLRHARDPAQ
jgi:hypothetical protein